MEITRCDITRSAPYKNEKNTNLTVFWKDEFIPWKIHKRKRTKKKPNKQIYRIPILAMLFI